MSKFFITSIVDIDKLNKKLDEFICTTGKSNPYLFMHKHTIDAIPNTDDTFSQLRQISATVNGIAGYYSGYKVFRDNTLNFGEVEIR